MIINNRAYARAGVFGNPSDGYFGKVIAISVKNFYAEVTLRESRDLRIEEKKQDLNVYRNIHDLVNKINLYGYYGGVRLIRATIKKFHDYCMSQDIRLEDKNFTIQYDSNIPRQLGLGGSSAIITAAIRSLMEYYEVKIPIKMLPSIVLDVELKELGINAGFMDRVIQVYEGCIYMDLDSEIIREKGHGIYERLDTKLIPELYLAYKPELGKVSGHVLDDIRAGYEKGDRLVINTLKRIAEIAEIGKKALLHGNIDELHDLMNENFDLRSKIMKINDSNLEMIQTARRCGASAKFAGSGGSIIGMYKDDDMFSRLASELEKIQAKVFKPVID
ncbi:MAG: GHMP kinase [Candidatus Aminicenantes bacterium]|nr:GHMP kinase [Candidatus Aminicenantes bacterium]MBL7082169.1 GHMP kinase [Candidatus Aminicenantes bacterium]